MDKIYIELILKVAKRLQELRIPWYLIGSTGLMLRNVDIGRYPKDIDFLIHSTDVIITKEAFEDYMPFCDERELGNGHGRQFRLRMEGRQIHFSAENDIGIYFEILGDKTIHERIMLKGFPIPVFPLQMEAKCYEEMGRPERVRLIRDFLY